MRINGGRLEPEEFSAFVKALRDAFDPKEFQIMLRDEMGWRILDREADDGFFTLMLNKAENDEETQALLLATLTKKPKSSLLNDFARQVGFSLQKQPSTTTSVPPPSANPSIQPSTQSPLERRVSELHSSLQPVLWRTLMEKRERQICLITVQGWEKAHGTGFLLGPDVVMTNYHVLKDVIDGPIPQSRVFLYFDYKLKEDGKTLESGSEHQLANDRWLLDHSEQDDLDKQSTEQCVDVDERHLDYALLRLKRKAGEELIDGTKRDWIEIPEMEYGFKPSTALLILHHPKGGTLTFDIDTRSVIEENTTKTRVRYTTNTERGSSGAPCFNANWELVALHQSGDPDFTHSAHYNQGIPIAAILRRLKRLGNEKYLGVHRKKTVRAKVPTEKPRPSAPQVKQVRSGACDESESA
jgi:Trypsin-like peptidase domain